MCEYRFEYIKLDSTKEYYCALSVEFLKGGEYVKKCNSLRKKDCDFFNKEAPRLRDIRQAEETIKKIKLSRPYADLNINTEGKISEVRCSLVEIGSDFGVPLYGSCISSKCEGCRIKEESDKKHEKWKKEWDKEQEEMDKIKQYAKEVLSKAKGD